MGTVLLLQYIQGGYRTPLHSSGPVVPANYVRSIIVYVNNYVSISYVPCFFIPLHYDAFVVCRLLRLFDPCTCALKAYHQWRLRSFSANANLQSARSMVVRSFVGANQHPVGAYMFVRGRWRVESGWNLV